MAAEHVLDARPAAARGHDDEVADRRVLHGLPVEDDRRAGLEERLAHDELPAAGHLADDGLRRRIPPAGRVGVRAQT